MKSNELRVNNFVLIYGIVHIVTEIHESVIFAKKVQESECQSDWFYFFDVKPIELNERWLLKFGFENKTQIGKGYRKDGVEYWFDKDGISIQSCQQIDYYHNVHQLQNLHFMMSCQELL